ncbi:aldehyde-activating protein [Sphingomonas koreensis]|nr:aldehyde-activating protein [Sphingomonas koreensis]
MTRAAACRCGQARIVCEGEPTRVSVCHCLNCQQRSGSAFAAQARFLRDQVTIQGSLTMFTWIGESGKPGMFHFCPTCGSTLWYETEAEPELIGVPIGIFADPQAFGPPLYSVYEERKVDWVAIISPSTEHYD